MCWILAAADLAAAILDGAITLMIIVIMIVFVVDLFVIVTAAVVFVIAIIILWFDLFCYIVMVDIHVHDYKKNIIITFISLLLVIICT